MDIAAQSPLVAEAEDPCAPAGDFGNGSVSTEAP